MMSKVLGLRNWGKITTGLTHIEKAVYVDLLAYQSADGSLPESVERMALIAGVSSEEMSAIWEAIGHMFVVEEKKETPLWKKDFSVYLRDARAAFRDLYDNDEFIEEQQKLNPGVNVKLTMEKMFKSFWGTEAGWKHKIKSGVNDIRWREVITNGMSIKMNRVYHERG